MSPRLSREQLLAILRGAELRHPRELWQRPLTWNGALAILKREGIDLERAAIATPAALLTLAGHAVIVLNNQLPVGRQAYYVAHELAHWWAHRDAEPVYYIGDGSCDQEREDEADVMATWLLAEPHIRAYLEEQL